MNRAASPLHILLQSNRRLVLADFAAHGRLPNQPCVDRGEQHHRVADFVSYHLPLVDSVPFHKMQTRLRADRLNCDRRNDRGSKGAQMRIGGRAGRIGRVNGSSR